MTSSVSGDLMTPAPQNLADLGARLRAARDLLGIDSAEFFRRSHIPAQIARQIERGEFERIGARIYQLGYLRAYARATALDEAELLRLLEQLSPAPEEPSAQGAELLPAPSNPFEQYSGAVGYLVGTALVLASGWYWLQHAGLVGGEQLATPSQVDGAQVDERLRLPGQTLDESEPAAWVDVNEDDVGPSLTRSQSPTVVPSPMPSSSPVVASLAPMIGNVVRRSEESRGDTPVAQSLAGLSLNFEQDSWVEVRSGDGKRLQYGLVPAGSNRHYPVQSGLQVIVGNVAGVQARLEGAELDLGTLARNNVANFRIPLDAPADPAGN